MMPISLLKTCYLIQKVHDAGGTPDVLMDPRAVGAPTVPYVDPEGRNYANGAPTKPEMYPGGRTYAIGAPTKHEIDPGGRSQAIGTAFSCLQGHHNGNGGAEHDPLLDVNVLSNHRDLALDRGQHSA